VVEEKHISIKFWIAKKNIFLGKLELKLL